MRPPIDRLRVHYFLVRLGIEFRHPARLYLVGGTTLVYEGLRDQSLDIDIHYEVADQHEAEFSDTVRRLKDDMQINVEHSSPGDFIPLPEGWKERAKFVGRFGQVDVFHFDLYSTALSKIERGREGDFQDVLALLRSGQITFVELREAYENIMPRMKRESLKRRPERMARNFDALDQMWRDRRTADRRDRFAGALLGLAVCDALGTAVEFMPPGTFTPLTGVVGGGAFHLQPGQWTDDTSMALCLAESLIACRGFDARDQLTRYVRWWKDGHLSSTGKCFDIGNTTHAALAAFARTGDPDSCGVTSPDAAGNGSIMRLAPIPMAYASDPAAAIERAAASSRTTHAMATAVDACRLLSALVVGALNGTRKDELLSDHYAPVEGYWASHPLVPEIDAIARGSYKSRNPPDIKGSGFVVASLEAALWAFHRGADFREGALLAVNLGDDADTTGAVYGQLAGAYYGAADIPPDWLADVAMRDLIDTFCQQLLELSNTPHG